MRLIPGDIFELRLAGSGGFFDQSALDTCRQNLGLEQNPFIQFVTWVWGLLQFDFGISLWTGREITHEIAIRFQLSLQLAIMTTSVSILIAIQLDVISEDKQDNWIEYVVRIFSIDSIAFAAFWLG